MHLTYQHPPFFFQFLLLVYLSFLKMFELCMKLSSAITKVDTAHVRQNYNSTQGQGFGLVETSQFSTY